MRRAVEQVDVDIDDIVTGDDPGDDGFLDPAEGGVDEFFRDGATDDLVVDRDALAWLVRAHLEDDVTVLPFAAGLLDELALATSCLGNGLAVGDLRFAGVGLYLELALHAFADDLEVQLAHALDDRLAGLLVSADDEGRILFAEALQRAGELVLVGGGPRLDRHRDDRFWKRRRLEHDFELRVTERVTGGDVAHTEHRGDIARVAGIDVGLLV